MKICVALHSCMDLGGIINHTEQLIGGLQDLGHRVDFRELVYSDRVSSVNRTGPTELGPSGIPFHQGKGWNFKREQRIPYKTSIGVQSAQQILNGYDMVIWTVPVPPKNKQHLGNDKWPDLYDLDPKVKQIAFIHDGNAKAGSPHILHIQEHLTAVACVHGCALNGADHLTVPRALILNPQDKPVRDIIGWDAKRPGFVNMQTFKAWKHVHELVEAIAYMPKKFPGELREVAGKGIEYQYMTSEDKCKENYFHGVVEGPDFNFSGEKFWDAALANGMVHHDYWDTTEVDQWLSQARVLVDPSWSKKYSLVGGHWNRVVVDAMIRGCVPVAQSRGMGSELFVAGEHYIDVGEARDAMDYAEIVIRASHMHKSQADQMIAAGRELLWQFDRRQVAQDLIALAFGSLDGMQVGTDDPAIRKKYEDLMFDQYGVLA